MTDGKVRVFKPLTQKAVMFFQKSMPACSLCVLYGLNEIKYCSLCIKEKRYKREKQKLSTNFFGNIMTKLSGAMRRQQKERSDLAKPKERSDLTKSK